MTDATTLAAASHAAGRQRGDGRCPVGNSSRPNVATGPIPANQIHSPTHATSALAFLRAHLGEDLTSAIADAERAVTMPLPHDPAAFDHFVFLGAGWSVGVANEAALKLRESAQAHTESYPAMEYRHGPISIAAPGRVTWHFGEPPTGLADDVAATGARFEAGSLDPMAELVRAQRVALARALDRGLDPDSPRNLTRSVILEG